MIYNQMFYSFTSKLISLAVVITLSITIYSFYFNQTETRILPKDSSTLNWKSLVISDHETGGESQIILNDDKYALDFQFILDHKINYPYIAVIISFDINENANRHVNLSKYDRLSFKAKCDSQNELVLSVLGFDPNLSQIGVSSSYSPPSVHFECTPEWRSFSFDLRNLDIPEKRFNKGLNI